MGVVLAGCAPKEYAAYNPKQSNWLRADAEAANLATVVHNPDIQPRTHFAAGQLFEQQGELRKAIIQYRKAIAAEHDYVPAYSRLGVLLGRLGRHSEAEQALTKAVELRPDWAFLRNNLGFEYMLQKRWLDAEAELRNAIRLQADFRRAHNNLAMVLFKTGRFEESLGEFRQAVPEPDAYYNLGLMFRGEHRYRDAANAFERVLSLASRFEAAKIQLAQIAPRLELETPLEPLADMGAWEIVAQAPNAPLAAEPEALTANPQALTGEVNAVRQDEALVATSTASQTYATAAVTEETSLAFVDDLSHNDILDEQPTEEQMASEPAVDQPESRSPDEQKLADATIVAFANVDPVIPPDATLMTPTDPAPVTPVPVEVSPQAADLPTERTPEILLADGGPDPWLNQEGFLFPDHPLGLAPTVAKEIERRKSVADTPVWEFLQLFDENNPGPMPPFDD